MTTLPILKTLTLSLQGVLRPFGDRKTLWMLLVVVAGEVAVLGEVAAPTVEVRAGEALGTTSFTANGRIHPHGLPTTYYFEYGATASYGAKTPAQALAPRLAAFYRESWDERLGGWLAGMSGKDMAHHAEGGAAKGFVRFSEPSGDDPNHVDGIGTLHLASYFYPGTHPGAEGLRALFGGGDPDLRDAKVKLWVRGNQWVANGTECVWWTQSDNDVALQRTPDWRRANWAYTGFSLNDFLASGKWEKIEYRLNNHSEDWTYGGNNLAQKRPNYAYDSVNNSQSRVSCDFFHLVAGVDPKNPPTGSIDFDEFELAYRNYSLLLASNGGQLTVAPGGSADDGGTLTDGWRHGAGRMWRSAANPAAPLEFTYGFKDAVDIQRVQIHQHPEWPSRGVEVLVSEDGQVWKTLFSGDVPERSPAGPNFVYLFKEGFKARARGVRVRILSGYKGEHWGLGEIEVFGAGAVMQTDDDWYHVNQDIGELKPGGSYHYRLVATSAAGTTRGEDQVFVVPADTRPHVVTRQASSISGGSAKVGGRLNAMGQRTQFHFEYGVDTTYGQKTAAQYGGLQIAPRAAFAILSGLKPGTLYHYRLVGVNESGTSHGGDATFSTK
jgi:hypothetical protein